MAYGPCERCRRDGELSMCLVPSPVNGPDGYCFWLCDPCVRKVDIQPDVMDLIYEKAREPVIRRSWIDYLRLFFRR
jgi:hypothetical protein